MYHIKIMCAASSLLRISVAQQLDGMSMSVLKFASCPRSNPFATYVKDILSRSTKTHTVTELLIS